MMLCSRLCVHSLLCVIRPSDRLKKKSLYVYNIVCVRLAILRWLYCTPYDSKLLRVRGDAPLQRAVMTVYYVTILFYHFFIMVTYYYYYYCNMRRFWSVDM